MPTLTCPRCSQTFEIDERDQAYYTKRGVPAPKLCPKDRLKRRLSFRNERKLYARTCDASGKQIVSNIRPDAPFPVFHTDEWQKQAHEVPKLEAFDFNRSFLEQFKELWLKAPRMHKATAGNEENSEYSNHCGNCRNCYFIFNSEEDQDCMYLKFGDKCQDCVDCHNIILSQLCYECVNVKNCYNLKFSDDCESCSDGAFLRNCRSTKNSMFCYGLDHQEFCLFNQKYSKEEYQEKIKEYRLDSYAGLQAAKKVWEDFSAQWPKMRHIILNSENCSGESIYNSKNCTDCYTVSNCEDCRFVLNSVDTKDSYDFFAYGMKTALMYEAITIAGCYDLKFCTYCMYSSNLEYCESCWACEDCFGCVGLKKAKFCIFNKQYTEEEYKALIPKIKDHMMKTGEYGEFFPEEFSHFPYEDSLAQDYFPEAEAQKTTKLPEGILSVEQIPDLVSQVQGDITSFTFLCPVTQKAFKFQGNEIKFYKKINVALPRMSFEARYKNRNQLIPFPYGGDA
ncbi:MAG: hypothetical protein WC777_05375 [Candidatus Gracilibacteria bacterium]